MANAMDGASYHLTFDIDWAPDFAIAEVLDILRPSGVKATFFVTHACDVLADIRKDGHTLGLHPNFLPGSSQGDTPLAIMETLLGLVPDATVLRTHALVQSTPLLQQIFGYAPQLTLDLSVLMYRFAHVGRFGWRLGDVAFERINYNWEDDIAFDDPSFDWSRPVLFGAHNVLDFHPIHVALNSRDNAPYQRLKAALDGRRLMAVGAADVAPFVNPQSGAATYLKAVLGSGHRAVGLEAIP
jgi:hypothetical protein